MINLSLKYLSKKRGESYSPREALREEITTVRLRLQVVTMYDRGGFQVANLLNGYAIGDREWKYSVDGSLDLYPRQESPGVTRRFHAPKAEALDRRLATQAMKRVR